MQKITIRFVFFTAAAVCFILKGVGLHTGQVDLMNIGFGLLTIGSMF
jgi:hypothetical protein